MLRCENCEQQLAGGNTTEIGAARRNQQTEEMHSLQVLRDVNRQNQHVDISLAP